jgi:hypothetical protein
MDLIPSVPDDFDQRLKQAEYRAPVHLASTNPSPAPAKATQSTPKPVVQEIVPANPATKQPESAPQLVSTPSKRQKTSAAKAPVQPVTPSQLVPAQPLSTPQVVAPPAKPLNPVEAAIAAVGQKLVSAEDLNKKKKETEKEIEKMKAEFARLLQQNEKERVEWGNTGIKRVVKKPQVRVYAADVLEIVRQLRGDDVLDQVIVELQKRHAKKYAGTEFKVVRKNPDASSGKKGSKRGAEKL